MLSNKTVVLGITGGIAAYKAADLASKLTQSGARVEVIMTESATEFITPLTLRNITGRQVVTEMFDVTSEYSVEHVALAEAADVMSTNPVTIQLRYMQTLSEISTENASTIVFPMPIRFLEGLTKLAGGGE